jgi:ribosomal protein L37AE/L43A
MSAAFSPICVGPVHPLTGIRLTARAFKVCENCGCPAIPHPRREVISITNGERATVLCCACLHTVSRHDNQLWTCGICGETRAWGFGRPWDSMAKPVLACGQCGAATRHRFLGVVGQG